MEKKKCLNIHVLFHISNSHRYGIRRGMLGFLIATLHEHKHCKRRFFYCLVKKKNGTILKNVFLNIHTYLFFEYTKCFFYSFQVMLAFDLKVRKLSKDK